MKLRWSQRSCRDLEEIRRFVAADDPDAAGSWVARLRERARKAAHAPQTGRMVPELERHDVREVLLKAYRLVYLVRPTDIVMLTVFESHRLLPVRLARVSE
jgi:toxin ParE1/3/4